MSSGKIPPFVERGPDINRFGRDKLIPFRSGGAPRILGLVESNESLEVPEFIIEDVGPYRP